MNRAGGLSRFLVVALLLASTAVAPRLAGAAGFPAPNGRVNDFAGVLDQSTRAALQGIISDTEQKTASEIAVVTVPSLDGMTVEDYAVGLFKAWGIGKKGSDNGVLILVCPAERKMRIEVGYGLEGVLPDGLSGEVIRQQFTPAFKDGNYSRGILEGVGRISEIVRGNHVLTADEIKRAAGARGRAPATVADDAVLRAVHRTRRVRAGCGAADEVDLRRALGRHLRRHPGNRWR